jgi:tetratricopeptide (TPR) repeat protein
MADSNAWSESIREWIEMKGFAAILLLCMVALPFAARAESAADLMEKGNEHYAAGRYDEALKAYEEAGAELPESGEISFNKGNAYFRKGEYEKAKEAYEAAAIHTKDPSLEARSQFNLGNTAFATAEALVQKDMKKSLAGYEQSILHYRNGLRIDPNIEEAAENIEMTRLRMKDLLDQIKQQEEESKEQQKEREELRKQLDEVIQEQGAEIKDNDSLKEKASREPAAVFDDEAEKLESDQGGTRRKTEEISQKLKTAQCPLLGGSAKDKSSGPAAQDADLTAQPQPQSQEPAKQPDQSVADHVDNALNSQQSAIEGLGRRELDQAKGDQEKALQELKEALAKLTASREKPPEDRKNDGGRQDQQQKPEHQNGRQEPQSAEQQPDSGEKSDESASKQSEQSQQQQDGQSKPHQQQESSDRKKDTGAGEESDIRKATAGIQEKPEDILREEKENRLQLQRSRSRGYQPVEKDW